MGISQTANNSLIQLCIVAIRQNDQNFTEYQNQTRFIVKLRKTRGKPLRDNEIRLRHSCNFHTIPLLFH